MVKEPGAMADAKAFVFSDRVAAVQSIEAFAAQDCPAVGRLAALPIELLESNTRVVLIQISTKLDKVLPRPALRGRSRPVPNPDPFLFSNHDVRFRSDVLGPVRKLESMNLA